MSKENSELGKSGYPPNSIAVWVTSVLWVDLNVDVRSSWVSRVSATRIVGNKSSRVNIVNCSLVNKVVCYYVQQ